MSAEKFVSERIKNIGASGIRKIFDLAATMTDPIDLSMGQPDFKVPDAVKNAAIDAIRNDKNGYTVTYGIPALRERISAMLREKRDWSPETIVTSGVSGGLVITMMACLNPGDEALIVDPYFVSYKHIVTLAGGTPVTVDINDDFTLKREAFEAAITPRTKLILLNSPSNPAGVVFSAAEIQSICELARERDLLIVSDEIYETLSFDGPAASPVQYAPERTVLLGGFGKSHAITGWRMGYAAGPAPVIREMAKVQQFTFVCGPHPAQIATVVALDTDMSEQVEAYRIKRDLIVSELAGSFEFAKPAGGFFLFCKAPPQFETGTAFVEEAIKHNILMVPGSAFSERDTHFRISYAVPNETLKRACEILRPLAG